MSADAERKHLRRRRFREMRFRVYCAAAVAVAVIFLGYFLFDIVRTGYPAFWQAKVRATIRYTEMSVRVPKLAVAPELRPVVTRGRLRVIPKNVKKNPRAEIQVRIPEEKRGAGVSGDPLDAVELPADVEGVAAKDLRPLIGERGMAEVRAALRGERAPRTEADRGDAANRWVWASDPVQRYMEAMQDADGTSKRPKGESGGRAPSLSPSLIDSLDALNEAGLLRLKYNHRMGTAVTEWVPARSEVDQFLQLPDGLSEKELQRATTLSPKARARVRKLREAGDLQFGFNRAFFTNGDAQLPEQAGVLSAAVGSVFLLLVVAAVSFPIGVLTAVYLEELAPDNKLTQIIEVNINNLAAVPSILFGLLGLAAFINFFGLPRSSALVGGLTLSLMTLPIVIISARAALRAVPDSIRLGAMAMGATRWQAVCHHVLPQSLSGMLTGTIIGLAQAIGETAPLLIVGMVAFIPATPSSVTDPTTALPALVYKWSTSAQSGFEELTAAGILVLLTVLLLMNATAVIARARFERRG